MKSIFILLNKVDHRKLLWAFLLLTSNYLTAQIKIGDNPDTIDSASLLELESSNRAMVLSRVTSTQMQAIVPLQGALVYNTDLSCVFYFDGNSWSNLCTGGGPVGATLVANDDDSYTFTNSAGVETLISFNGSGGGSVSGEPGSVFFAGTNGNSTENNNQLFWDEANNRLGIGTNATGLPHKLTVDGTIGVADGTTSEPAYRFLDDSDTGIYSSAENEIAFSVGGRDKAVISQNGLLLNETVPDNDIPLVIKSNGEQRFIAFKEPNNNSTIFNLNWRNNGINFDDTLSSRLFIGLVPPNLGQGDTFVKGVGIDTNHPEAILDVNGDLRVRQLPNSVAGDNVVTVDAEGFFHRSSVAGKSSNIAATKNYGARWTNGASNIDTINNEALVSIFGNEDYKDGGVDIYESNGHSLTVKTVGRYDIRANLSLISNFGPKGKSSNIWARISINGMAKGAICVANNDSSSTTNQTKSGIHLNEILQLKANDVITIILYAENDLKKVELASTGSSSFTIVKIKP